MVLDKIGMGIGVIAKGAVTVIKAVKDEVVSVPNGIKKGYDYKLESKKTKLNS